MGFGIENVTYGPHAPAGSAVTGRRLTITRGDSSRIDESGDAGAAQHAALVSAANTSQAAFDSAAGAVWGAGWYGNLSTAEKAAARAVVSAY